MKLFLIFYTLLSLAEDNNNGWSLNEKLYENSLFNIVGNNSKLDLSRYSKENQDNGFGSSPYLLPYRNLGTFIIIVSKGKYNIIKKLLKESDYNITIVNEYENNGFSLYLSPKALKWVLSIEGIELIDEDFIVTINNEVSTQCELPWGIDHIDHKGINCEFDSGMLKGKGSHIYIIDTGINPIHNEFQDRLGEGFNSVDIGEVPDHEIWGDCNGHGTHCAGTAAGTKYGIAKESTIHSVRVLSCEGSGYYSWVINGLNWIQNHVKTNGIDKAVVSMSLGGGYSKTLNQVVNNLIKNKIEVIVAAGNNNNDACLSSPASAQNAITVGSSTNINTRSSFSNYGNCVDIFAPGSNIKSSWIGSSSSINTISGTSMATPHVAGVVALLLATDITPDNIKSELITLSDKDIIKDSKTISNYLVRVPYISYPTSPPTLSPTSPPTLSPTPQLRKKNDILWIVFITILVLLLIGCIIYSYCNNSIDKSNDNPVSINNVANALNTV